MNKQTLALVRDYAGAMQEIQRLVGKIDFLKKLIDAEEEKTLDSEIYYHDHEKVKISGAISTDALKELFDLPTSREVMEKMIRHNARIDEETGGEKKEN